jgi:hypothetical protein
VTPVSHPDVPPDPADGPADADVGTFGPAWAYERLSRPYTLTQGRTVPSDASLALEALVEMTWEGYDAVDSLQFEARQIITLAQETMSVAEVAVHLKLPIGVARVLVSDLADEGYVIIHPPSTGESGGGQDPSLLEKVLHGLRSL